VALNCTKKHSKIGQEYRPGIAW